MENYGVEFSFYAVTAFAIGALLLSFLLPDIREHREER
jgi:hypothetical protein